MNMDMKKCFTGLDVIDRMVNGNAITVDFADPRTKITRDELQEMYTWWSSRGVRRSAKINTRPLTNA